VFRHGFQLDTKNVVSCYKECFYVDGMLVLREKNPMQSRLTVPALCLFALLGFACTATDKASVTADYLRWFVENQSGDAALANRLTHDFRAGYDSVIALFREGKTARYVATQLRLQGKQVVLLEKGNNQFELPGKTVSYLIMDRENGCHEITRETWSAKGNEGPASITLVGLGEEDVTGNKRDEKQIHLFSFELPLDGDNLTVTTNSLSPFGKIVVGFVIIIGGTGCSSTDGPEDEGADGPTVAPTEPVEDPTIRVGSVEEYLIDVGGEQAKVTIEFMDIGQANPSFGVKFGGDLPADQLKWIQIVIDTDSNGDRSRPNFDGLITQGELAADHEELLPQREARVAAHDPFYRGATAASSALPPEWFHDVPTAGQYEYFDAYTMLTRIERRGPPNQWKATLVGVFRWTYIHRQRTNVSEVSNTNARFRRFLEEANRDFDNGFSLNTWYDGSPP